MPATDKSKNIEPTSIRLRPVTSEDDAFLFKVYAGTRAEEMALTGWLPVQQQLFLRNQFELQKRGYTEIFPNADHVIILRDGEPVGRMMVDRANESEIRGVDIAVLPDARSAGVGSFLIRNLLDEAKAAGKPFRIQVEKTNWRALRLYDRLGFVRTGETETHIALEWKSLSGKS